MKKLLLLVVSFVLLAWSQTLYAQAFTFTSGQLTYNETFDGMGSTGTTYLTGWSGARYAGTGTLGPLPLVVTDGSANSGAVYNVGATGIEERALGTLGSGSTIPRMGAFFTNSTGSSISQVTLSGVMEQWRSGSTNTVTEICAFEYSTDATDLLTGTWTPVTNFDLVEKITTSTTAAALDGNLPDNQTAITASINGIVWPAGTNFWIRWSDINDLGSDGIYSIDNLIMTVSSNASPAISVSSPASGNQWRQGTTYNITWSASLTNPNVMIEFTDNASAGTPTWTTLNPSIAASAGSWAWNIPAGQALSNDCKIRITDIPVTATGLSGIFSIVPPPAQIATLAELRAVAPGTEYTYVGQGILTFQQSFRKQKYIQDATAAILIDDNAGKITTTYNIGDAITNISGTVAVFNGMTQFTPVSDPGPAASTGNSITPESVTLAQLSANWENYEAEVIKVPSVTFTNPSGNFANGLIYPVTDNAGTGRDFRTTFFDVDYIGTPVPTVTQDLVVIPNSRIDGDHITSRNLADMVYNSSNSIMITEIMYNPIDGGNDTIEFIELYNSGSVSVNMKDWYFSAGVTYVFPDISIAPNSYYVIARDAASMQNTFGITCTQWTEGFLDDAGEAIVLNDAIGQVKDNVYYLPVAPWPTTPNNGGPSLTFCDATLDNSLGENWSASSNQVAVNGSGDAIFASPGSSCSTGANLVITEIMFNPPESGTDSLEFIEIYNLGNTMNLEGFYFSTGIVFEFPSVTLANDEYILVSVNSAAIQNTFGKSSLQWTSGGLSNSGEAITLKDNYGVTIDEVTYANAAPWYPAANGEGPSLTLCDPSSNNALPVNWKASNEYAAINAAGDSIFATPLGGCVNPPTVANFEATPTSLLEGESVQFTDLSTNNPTAWEWVFTGGTPAASTEQNPLIQYTAYGVYSVSLTATNEFGSSSITKTDYISVGVDGITNLPSTLSVYPNPTNGKLFVTNPANQTLEITMYTGVGKLINSTTSDESVISLDVTGQSKGLYIVKITNKMNQNVQVQKVVLK